MSDRIDVDAMVKATLDGIEQWKGENPTLRPLAGEVDALLRSKAQAQCPVFDPTNDRGHADALALAKGKLPQHLFRESDVDAEIRTLSQPPGSSLAGAPRKKSWIG